MATDVDLRTLTYLYGIVDATADVEAVTPPGVGDPPSAVHVVRAGDIAAVVSDVPADRELGTRQDLRAHTDVLGALLDATDVAPMRFGVLLPEHLDVAELLEAEAAGLRSVLDGVTGCVEVGLTVTQDEEAAMVLALQSDRRLQRLRERARTVAQQVQLGEAVAGALAAQRQDVAAAVLDRLGPLAVDVVESPVRDERTALRAAFLVGRDGTAAFDDAVDQLGEELGDRFTFKVVAPLPPYSFTELHLDLSAEDDRWGS